MKKGSVVFLQSVDFLLGERYLKRTILLLGKGPTSTLTREDLNKVKSIPFTVIYSTGSVLTVESRNLTGPVVTFPVSAEYCKGAVSVPYKRVNNLLDGSKISNLSEAEQLKLVDDAWPMTLEEKRKSSGFFSSGPKIGCKGPGGYTKKSA